VHTVEREIVLRSKGVRKGGGRVEKKWLLVVLAMLQKVGEKAAKLKASASGRYTADREELLKSSNSILQKRLAAWLSEMSGLPVREEVFTHDLSDGTVLCKIMNRVPGSGLKSFKNARKSPRHLKAFHARDNLVQYQDACRRVGIDPVSTEQLQNNETAKVLSALVQLEELCTDEEVEPLGTPPQEDFDAMEKPPEVKDSGISRPQEEEKLIKRDEHDKVSKKRRSKRFKANRLDSDDPLEVLAAVVDKVKQLCGCGREAAADDE